MSDCSICIYALVFSKERCQVLRISVYCISLLGIKLCSDYSIGLQAVCLLEPTFKSDFVLSIIRLLKIKADWVISR